MANGDEVMGLSNEDLIEACEDASRGWRPMAEINAIHDELLRRLSAGNPQANNHCASCRCTVLSDAMRKPERSDGRIETGVMPLAVSDGRITERDFQIATQDPVFVRLFEHYKAEAQQAASDGRIETDEQADARYRAILDYSVRMPSDSGEQRETRIQGESSHAYDGCHDCRVASAANVDREQLVAMVQGEKCWRCREGGDCGEEVCRDPEAQRSAGRVEAGSEQPEDAECLDRAEDAMAPTFEEYAFPMACHSCGAVHDALAQCQDSENGAVTRDGGKIKP